MSSPKSPLFTGLWEWATLGSNRPNFPLCNNRVFQNYHFSWGLRVGDSKIDLIFHCTTIGLSKISTFCWAPGVGYSKINLILHCTTMFLGDVYELLINPELRTSKASLFHCALGVGYSRSTSTYEVTRSCFQTSTRLRPVSHQQITWVSNYGKWAQDEKNKTNK